MAHAHTDAQPRERRRIGLRTLRPDGHDRLDGRRVQQVAEWHDAAADEPPGGSLRRTIEAAVIDNATRVWAAGEAASAQAIRKHLFEQRDVPRAHTTIRGYWKVPR